MFFLITIASNAQYKKASFFERDGRTFELGTDTRILTKGRSLQQGIHVAFGREMSQRFFYNYEFELTLPSKYKTLTNVELNTNEYYRSYSKENISGKSKTGLLFRLNFGYFLKDDEDEKNKLVPFLTLGLHYKFIGLKLSIEDAVKTTSYYEIPYGESPSSGSSGSAGINLGVGGLYKITNKIGFKFNGGYNVEISANPIFSNGSIDIKSYEQFISHPYISLGLRYKIIGKEY